MLVLTRKTGQRIQIADSICITVVRVQGDQVRIGIEAPRDVSILREELLDQRAASADVEATLSYELLAAS